MRLEPSNLNLLDPLKFDPKTSLWVYDVEKKQSRRVARPTGLVAGPTWVGGRIAYHAMEHVYRLMAIDLAAGSTKTLRDTIVTTQRAPSVSCDGQRVYFVETTPQGAFMRAMALDGKTGESMPADQFVRSGDRFIVGSSTADAQMIGATTGRDLAAKQTLQAVAHGKRLNVLGSGPGGNWLYYAVDGELYGLHAKQRTLVNLTRLVGPRVPRKTVDRRRRDMKVRPARKP